MINEVASLTWYSEIPRGDSPIHTETGSTWCINAESPSQEQQILSPQSNKFCHHRATIDINYIFLIADSYRQIANGMFGY